MMVKRPAEIRRHITEVKMFCFRFVRAGFLIGGWMDALFQSSIRSVGCATYYLVCPTNPKNTTTNDARTQRENTTWIWNSNSNDEWIGRFCSVALRGKGRWGEAISSNQITTIAKSTSYFHILNFELETYQERCATVNGQYLSLSLSPHILYQMSMMSQVTDLFTSLPSPPRVVRRQLSGTIIRTIVRTTSGGQLSDNYGQFKDNFFSKYWPFFSKF